MLGLALNSLFARLQRAALDETGNLQESVQEDFLHDVRWPAAGQRGRG